MSLDPNWTHFSLHCFLDADRLTRFYRPADSKSLGVQTDFKDSPQLLLGQNIYIHLYLQQTILFEGVCGWPAKHRHGNIQHCELAENMLIRNQRCEWPPVALSISWFSVDCRKHGSFRSQEEDGEFSEIAKPAAASQILRFAIGQLAYQMIKALPKCLLLHRLHIVPFCLCNQCPTTCDS